MANGTRRSRARRPLGAAASLLVSVAALHHGLSGCISPPALLPNGPLVTELSRFPQGTEEIELELAGGERLRGLYVPADPGAPLVLQFAESSVSALSSNLSYRRLFRDCADAGFAALMIDYRGVGRSDGEREIEHLPEDALAMWRAALEKVDGDPSRIIVRGASIGSIAAATLIERGVEPAAWWIVAPVRPQTVVGNFARKRYGSFIAFLAAPWFRPVADLALEEQIARVRAPLLVVGPRDDFLLPEAEQVELRRAVECARGAWRESAFGHEWTVVASHELSAEDRDFLRAIFPGWPDTCAREARALAELPADILGRMQADAGWSERFRTAVTRTRLAPAELVAAATCRPGDVEVRVAALRRAFDDRSRAVPSLGFEAAVEWFDSSDPAGDLPSALLVTWWHELGSYRGNPDVFGCPTSVPAVLELARDVERDVASGSCSKHVYDLVGGRATHVFPCVAHGTVMEKLGLPHADARRQTLRILLKSLAIPDRVRTGADGRSVVEALVDGAWVPVSLDAPVAADAIPGRHPPSSSPASTSSHGGVGSSRSSR